MSYGIILSYALQTLLSSIPTYLVHMLEGCIRKVERLKRLLKSNQQQEEEERRVYDLGNCGPRNRFMVGNLIAHNCQYGAGARKIHKTLTMNDVDISLPEVQEIYDGYWNLYSGIRKYQKHLEQQWKLNKGFILNGMGRPIGVHADYTKDLFNRNVQSTGHDILVLYIHKVTQELRRIGIPYTPYIIDWHDAVTVEVPEEHGPDTARVLESVIDTMNQEMGTVCPLRGKAVIGRNLAEVKEPEV